MADGRWQMADGRWQMADGREIFSFSSFSSRSLVLFFLCLVDYSLVFLGSSLLFLFCHLPFVITPSVTKIIILLRGQRTKHKPKISHKFFFIYHLNSIFEQAEWQIADSRWQMADGRWQMADGRWQMADGRWQRDLFLFFPLFQIPCFFFSVSVLLIILLSLGSSLLVLFSPFVTLASLSHLNKALT